MTRLTAKAELATANVQGAGRSVGPRRSPARVALALVVAGRGAVVATKVWSKAAVAVALVVSLCRNSVSSCVTSQA